MLVMLCYVIIYYTELIVVITFEETGIVRIPFSAIQFIHYLKLNINYN